MTAYYIMLSGISLCGCCLCVKNRSRLKDGVFLFISFAVLGVMSAVRYDVGIDYSYIYSPLYEEFMAGSSGVPWEPGFTLLLSIIYKVTPNYQALFVVTSMLMMILVMLYYWLYSPNPFISVFLFIALSQYYCSMDFIRQMLAAVITMYALPLLKSRSLLAIEGYFAIILLAASFHKSALIMMPFFLINLIPVNKYVLAAYAAIAAVIYFSADRIVGIVTRYWYSQYVLEDEHMQTAFTPQFTIAAAVVLVVVFLGSGLLSKLDKRNYLYVNYAFFTAFFVLMGTRYSILDRLSMYFELLAPVAIAIIVHQLAEKLREEKSMSFANRHAAAFAALLLTIFGGGLAIHQYALKMDHHGVVPYKIIFNQPFYKDYVDSLKGDRQKPEAGDAPAIILPYDPHIDTHEKHSTSTNDENDSINNSLNNNSNDKDNNNDSNDSNDNNDKSFNNDRNNTNDGEPIEVFLEDFD